MKRSFGVNIAAAGAGLGLLLAGCGESGPDIDRTQPAWVLAMNYDDEDTTNVPVCMSRDKNGLCTFTVNVPVTDPEHWSATLRQCPDGARRPQEDQECIIESIEITEGNFAVLSVGDNVRFEDETLVRIPQ